MTEGVQEQDTRATERARVRIRRLNRPGDLGWVGMAHGLPYERSRRYV